MKYFTGVGSRAISPQIAAHMELISIALHASGYRLRSGGAEGSDIAFQAKGFSPGDIYLPWKSFNSTENRMNSRFEGERYRYIDTPKLSNWFEALEILDTVRSLDTLPVRSHRLLHGRNVYQVLGEDLRSPSDLLVCWTPEGKDVGGTATAIKLARKYGVRIINLAVEAFTSEDII